MSVANVENAHHSTQLLAQTTLRTILGTKNLHEILSDRRVSSHLTPHTSHVARHTSHVTPHTSHLTPHSSDHTDHLQPTPDKALPQGEAAGGGRGGGDFITLLALRG